LRTTIQQNSSGRTFVQPLSRNTARGASRIQEADGAASKRGARMRHYVLVFFFFFDFFAMTCVLVE
jgi:hypothetical protein